MIKKYNQFITEEVYLTKDFGISYQDLTEILFHITDEFLRLEFYVEDSSHSFLIEKDDNCFIILFNESGYEYHNLPVLHYLEPKIFELIEDVNAHLKQFNLYVYASDFGESDAYYELVVSKIGHTPKNTIVPSGIKLFS
jgi:hypothetical protein